MESVKENNWFFDGAPPSNLLDQIIKDGIIDQVNPSSIQLHESR